MDIKGLVERLAAQGDDLSSEAAQTILLLVAIIDDINDDTIPSRALLRAYTRLTAKGEKDAADATYKALAFISERTRIAREKLGQETK